MTPMGVLADMNWMCDANATFNLPDHGNARLVHASLASGDMPPDGAWPPEQLTTYERWMVEGFQP